MQCLEYTSFCLLVEHWDVQTFIHTFYEILFETMRCQMLQHKWEYDFIEPHLKYAHILRDLVIFNIHWCRLITQKVFDRMRIEAHLPIYILDGGVSPWDVRPH